MIAVTRSRQRVSWILMVAMGLVALLGGTGCDELGNLLSWGGLVNPYYTSAWGLPAYPTTGFDPTSIIEGVNANRLGAMETAADGWDDFVLQ